MCAQSVSSGYSETPFLAVTSDSGQCRVIAVWRLARNCDGVLMSWRYFVTLPGEQNAALHNGRHRRQKALPLHTKGVHSRA
jgi:hypothetical protein